MAISNRTIDFRLEGTRFANFNQTIGTGIALSGATQNSFVATTPSILIVNNDTGAAFAGAGSETGQKIIYLDHLILTVVSAGTTPASLQAAIVIDKINRYASGGINISANSVDTDQRDAIGGGTASIALVYLTPTATAASAPRIVGRFAIDAAIPTVNDVYLLDWGGIAGISGIGRAIEFPLPTIAIAPGQSALIYIWPTGTMTAAPTFEYGLTWVED